MSDDVRDSATRIARKIFKQLAVTTAPPPGLERDAVNMIAAELQRVTDEKEQYREFIVSHGECHADDCGDDSSLAKAERLAYIRAHTNICTCGAKEIHRLACGGMAFGK